MSTHWGFVCQSHDPELISEAWFNHGDGFLTQVFATVRAGQWPENEWGEPEPTRFGGHGEVVGPIYWLREHPRCKVALRNEYGVTKEIE